MKMSTCFYDSFYIQTKAMIPKFSYIDKNVFNSLN